LDAGVASTSDEGAAPPSGGGEGLPAHVTRTMAEIFVRQGFPDRAIEVYEQILEREPGDGRILERIAELEREVEAPHEVVTLPAEDPGPSDEDDPALEKVAPHWAGSESDPPTDREPVTAFGWSDDETVGPREGETSDPPAGTDMPFDPSQLSIRSHFADLLAWVPGGVPIEDLAPDAPIERAPEGSPAAVGASTGAQAARGGVEPAVPASDAGDARGSAGPEPPTEALAATDPDPVEAAGEDEDLDDFRNWLESLEP
jgi:hypothetical protein